MRPEAHLKIICGNGLSGEMLCQLQPAFVCCNIGSGGKNMIQALFIVIFTTLVGLVAFLIGLIVRVILKLMKEELNLKIKIGPDSKD